jgi:peptidoglycan hydrolase CwlO-like protein
MANVFAILAAIVLAVSAFLAVKNSQAYFNEDLVNPGIIQQRQELEKDRRNNLDTIARLQGELDETNKNRIDTEGKSADKLTELQEQEKMNEEIEAKITENRQTIQSNQQKIDDTKARIAEIGEIETLVPKLEQLKSDIEGLKTTIGENEAQLAQLTSEIKRTDGVIADFQDKNRKISNKESYFTRTRIRSVFGTWGFVTLAAGNSSGVVQGSILDVVRDGETVAQLLVTAVEAGSAAADVIPDSLKEDTVLMVGDSVVPAKKEVPEVPAAPAAPAPPEPAPAVEPAPAPDAFDDPAPDAFDDPAPAAGDAADPFQ